MDAEGGGSADESLFGADLDPSAVAQLSQETRLLLVRSKQQRRCCCYVVGGVICSSHVGVGR